MMTIRVILRAFTWRNSRRLEYGIRSHYARTQVSKPACWCSSIHHGGYCDEERWLSRKTELRKFIKLLSSFQRHLIAITKAAQPPRIGFFKNLPSYGKGRWDIYAPTPRVEKPKCRSLLYIGSATHATWGVHTGNASMLENPDHANPSSLLDSRLYMLDKKGEWFGFIETFGDEARWVYWQAGCRPWLLFKIPCQFASMLWVDTRYWLVCEFMLLWFIIPFYLSTNQRNLHYSVNNQSSCLKAPNHCT